MQAFWVALGVIFVAELGDKSQLLAMAMAARYGWVRVILGLSVATAVMIGVSVAIGAVVGANLPTQPITIVAGVAFLAFAAWTWWEDGRAPDDAGDGDDGGDGGDGGDGNGDGGDELATIDERASGSRSPVIVASALFAVSEVGDKTMLATIALAAQNGWLGTWAGATIGMVAADALAIVVGTLLGARLPRRAVAIGSAVLFAIFGVLLLVEGVRG